jgi:hypothetical protein
MDIATSLEREIGDRFDIDKMGEVDDILPQGNFRFDTMR